MAAAPYNVTVEAREPKARDIGWLFPVRNPQETNCRRGRLEVVFDELSNFTDDAHYAGSSAHA